MNDATVTLLSTCLLVDTVSMGVTDPDHEVFLLGVDADDAALGSALLEALRRSKQYSSNEEFKEALALAMQKSKTWEAEAVKRSGLKTRTRFWEGSRIVSVRSEGAFIKLNPTMHQRLGNFRGSKDLEKVIVPSTSSLAEVGAAVRLALSRCTQKDGN